MSDEDKDEFFDHLFAAFGHLARGAKQPEKKQQKKQSNAGSRFAGVAGAPSCCTGKRDAKMKLPKP